MQRALEDDGSPVATRNRVSDSVLEYDQIIDNNYVPTLTQGADVHFLQPGEANHAPASDAPSLGTPQDLDDLESAFLVAQRNAELYTDIGQEVSRFLRRYRNLTILREEVLLLQSKVVHAREDRDNQQNFVQESQGNFLDELSHCTEPSTDIIPMERLLQLHKVVIDDHQRQFDRSKQLNEIEIEFGNRLFLLQKRERKAGLSLSKISSLARELSLPITSQLETEPSSPSEVSEDNLPPLVRHYFEKIGDYDNQREANNELELECRENRARRMLRVDQGEALSVTDEDFEAQYSRQLLEAEQELQRLSEKIDLARQICVMEGLDPNAYRKQPSEATKQSSSASPVTSAPASAFEGNQPIIAEDRSRLSAQHNLLSEPFPSSFHNHDAPISNGLSFHSPPKISHLDERVRIWIEGVSDDVLPPARARAVSETGQKNQKEQLTGRPTFEERHASTNGSKLRPVSLDRHLCNLTRFNTEMGLSPFIPEHAARSLSSPGPSNGSRQDAITFLRSLSTD